MDRIRPLFQAGDWELGPSTKMLESDRATLLLKDYSNLGGGKVKIEPCTIVFLSDAAAESEEQRLRQSVILRAPTAILQFDRDLDLKQPREANLRSAELSGEIIIHSDWKQPGPDDDLRITTKNIQLNEQSISTPERVDFRWGPHFGSGRDMQIKLQPGKGAASGMNVGGIESFELRHIDRLHLVGPEKGISPIIENGASPKSDASALPATTPIDISCSGPFRFEVIRHVATFRDNVRVVKPNPSGEPDQIACGVLSLWFIERPKDPPAAPPGKTAKSSGSFDLQPERLEATGDPVVVTAPSHKLTARGQRIEYNLVSKSIALDGDQPVFLQQGPSEIHARSLHYQADENEERLGQLVSQGPGHLRGQSADRPGQQLEAVWRDELRIQSREQYKVISLTGGGELKSPGVGQLQAKTVSVWLTETPSPKDPKKFELKPHGLSASDDVRFGSQRLSGRVDLLEVWFEEGGGGQRSAFSDQSFAAGNPSLPAASVSRSQAMDGLPPIAASSGTAYAGAASPQLPQTAQSHFEVTGRRLRARVLLPPGAEPALSDLMIDENVQFVETQTAQPGEQPVLIRCNHLEVVKAYAPDAVATIVGQPAHFEGRGLGLTGAAIKLNVGTNRLSIDGPGQADILIANDLEHRPLPTPCKLTVDWQQGMNFDGRTAHFEQSVIAATPGMPSQDGMTEFRLNTSTMDVQLDRAISFSDSKTREKPQVEEIRCKGGVTIDSHSFDARQQLVSHERMEVTDLAINQLGGGLTGGPGWINTVRYGSDDMVPGQPAAAPAAPAKRDQLYCLHVKFQRGITGNVLFRRVTFRDQVRATFGPVDNWDAMLTTDNPAKLGPKGVVARCDELQVFQPLLPVGGRRAIEIYALGNAQVEGLLKDVQYKALGSRIMYAQAKETLIIEGDGRAPAELFRQTQPGAPASRLPAQRIRYSLKTGEPEVDGLQMLEVPLPSGNEKK
jgi:hypothetical protein